MCDQKYLQLLKKVLDFNLEVLNPWQQDTAKKKLTRLFHLFIASYSSVVIMFYAFAHFERNHLTFSVITENLATATVFFRSATYVLLVLRFYKDYSILISRLIDERTQLPTDLNQQKLTEKFCRREFISISTFCCSFTISCVFISNIFVYFFPNEYQLPYSCYIFFMPPDAFLFAWELNYFFVEFTLFFAVIFFVSFAPLPLMLMNQTCWLLDMALATLDDLNKDLLGDEDFVDAERVRKINDHLKDFVERCEKIIEWRNEVQLLLLWNFDIEFQIHAIILCLTIYAMSSNFFASYIILNIFAFGLVELFIYCWMGTRVTNRIDQLSFEVSKNWYLMKPKQRKMLQMILHWTQSMKGFRGSFKDVKLEAFLQILEASYTFYTFLRSTGD